MARFSLELNQGYEPPVEEEKPSSLAESYIYPIKSFAGLKVNEWEVGNRGFRWDRNWMACTPEGKFLTQREIPPFSLIQPRISDQTLELSAPRMPILELPLEPTGKKVITQVWRSEDVSAYDQGDEVSNWLNTFVKYHISKLPTKTQKSLPELRLVAMDPKYVRQVNQVHALRETDQVGLADGYPFLLISQGSLDELNRRLSLKRKPSLSINRFRPNLVSSDSTPNIEDTWKTIRIGEVEFDVVKPCARCNITRVEQTKGLVAGAEPLATLSDYRKANQLGINETNDVMFGQNLIHKNQGLLRLNDPIEVLEYK